jgi:hypothetical protein
VPDGEHGSGTGDRWHGGKRRRWDGPLTPLRRFSEPFVTGPNPILIFLFRRQQCPLRGGTSRPGSGTSAPIRVFYRGPVPLVGLVESCGVNTVALQSTGVYWIPLYDILEERGFEVYLVNARHTKNLPGRKSDVQERPVVAEVAYLRIAEQLLLPAIGNSHSFFSFRFCHNVFAVRIAFSLILLSIGFGLIRYFIGL